MRPEAEVGAVLLGPKVPGPAAEGKRWWQVLLSECDKRLSSPSSLC